MDPRLSSPESALRAGLDRIRRRWFLHVWLRIGATWAIATLAVLVAATAVAVALRPAGVPLVVLGMAVPLLSVAALLVVTGSWWRRPSDLQVARFAEERATTLEQHLISAAEVAAKDRPRTAIETMVVRGGARVAASLDLDDVIPVRALRRRALVTVLAALALVLAAPFFAPIGERAWHTARALWFPASIALRVVPGDARVLAGRPLTVRVHIDGVALDAWSSPVVLEATARHLAVPVSLELRDGEFVTDLDAGNASFTYRVSSGRLASPEYRVTVRRPPRVDRISVDYEYPEFTGLAPRTDDDSGDVFAPEGTRLTVRVHTADPVASGALTMSGAGPIPLAARGDRLLEGQFVLSGDDAYRVALSDGDGLSSDGDTEYFVRVMEDRPPDVRILRPGGDAKVTRLEEVAIEARADDDFGVSRFELVYAPRGGDERVVPLARDAGTSVTGQHTIFVEDLDVKPGDFVTYYVRARDVARGKRSTEARSDIFFLEVRPFNEEFEAAQSQAGMSAAGNGSFDDLVRLQKDIIVATWRLDRRKTGGQSAQDVRAVAKSQAEVRARAERAAQQSMMAPPRSRRQRGGQPPMPVMPQPAPAAEGPMQRAVTAMASAQKALENLDTAAALPHENEALNEILRAQADIRRRQVARQQSSSGGRGGQSGNQDLSALFDRELQRQQQTNYEQRATSEEQQPETPEDETLRRLRELAARQDQLGREQRELARRRSQVSAEEMKRRLERLTREQEELRRQADDLARRMQQQAQRAQGQQQAGQGQPQPSTQAGQQGQSSGAKQGQQTQGGGGSGSPDAERLREAVREMAGAAGALQGQSPDAASQRSDRALERLRAAERAARGATPDERRRQAGDLQSEARQLAEAERRLATEAAGAGGDPDSMRRLAGQQSRLAERAEALERGTRELAGQTGAQANASRGRAGEATARQAESLRRAASDLTRDRVGQRMRESADAARRAGEGQGDGAAAARQLADDAREAAQPLERLADALSSATGQDAEARRLSEDLARARALRDRLADADREASADAGRAGARPDGTESSPGQRRASAEAPQGPSRSGQQQGTQQQAGAQAGAGGGQQGQQGGSREASQANAQGQGGGRGQGNTGEVARDFLRDLRQRRDLLDALQRENPSLAGMLASLEGWTPSTSAPGTEAWKQDFARWEQLKKDVTLALERYESSLSARLAAREAKDRLDAGADDRPPDEWRRDVADYYKSIARKPRQ